MDPSHTIFVLIKRKLPALAKQDQPTMTFSSPLWHSVPKTQAKALFLSLRVSFYMFLSWSFILLVLWLSRKWMHVFFGGMWSRMILFDKMGWESVVCAVSQGGNWIIPGREGTLGNIVAQLPLNCGLESFIRLAMLPEVCACVCVCAGYTVCMYVSMCRQFPSVRICAH